MLKLDDFVLVSRNIKPMGNIKHVMRYVSYTQPTAGRKAWAKITGENEDKTVVRIGMDGVVVYFVHDQDGDIETMYTLSRC